jgi:hypothetical protein
LDGFNDFKGGYVRLTPKISIKLDYSMS